MAVVAAQRLLARVNSASTRPWDSVLLRAARRLPASLFLFFFFISFLFPFFSDFRFK